MAQFCHKDCPAFGQVTRLSGTLFLYTHEVGVIEPDTPHLLYPFICRWTLSCFYVLAIVNSAALNIGVCVFFLISVFIFLDIYLGVGFLGHIGSSIFSFF